MSEQKHVTIMHNISKTNSRKKMKNVRYNKQLTIALSKETFDKIARICAKDSVTRSALVRSIYQEDHDPDQDLTKERFALVFKKPHERHPSTPKGDVKYLNIRIDPTTLSNIKREALRNGIDATEIIRGILNDWEESWGAGYFDPTLGTQS